MSDKPEAQRINVHDGIDAHGAMGAQPDQQPIPQEVIAEGIRQVEGGAAFFGKPLKDCSREELYGAVIMGWYDAQEARGQLHNILNPPSPPSAA